MHSRFPSKNTVFSIFSSTMTISTKLWPPSSVSRTRQEISVENHLDRHPKPPRLDAACSFTILLTSIVFVHSPVVLAFKAIIVLTDLPYQSYILHTRLDFLVTRSLWGRTSSCLASPLRAGSLIGFLLCLTVLLFSSPIVALETVISLTDLRHKSYVLPGLIIS